MQKIITAADLKNAIRQLEDRQAGEWPLLKEQFLITYEGLKPLNVLKNTFKGLVYSPGAKSNILGIATGLTAGYLSNTLLPGGSGNLVKKLFGTILQWGASTAVANPKAIKSIAGSLLAFFSKKKVIQSKNS